MARPCPCVKFNDSGNKSYLGGPQGSDMYLVFLLICTSFPPDPFQAPRQLLFSTVSAHWTQVQTSALPLFIHVLITFVHPEDSHIHMPSSEFSSELWISTCLHIISVWGQTVPLICVLRTCSFMVFLCLVDGNSLFPLAWIHSMVHSYPSFTPPVFPFHQPRFQFLCSEKTLSVVKRFLQPHPAPQS